MVIKTALTTMILLDNFSVVKKKLALRTFCNNFLWPYKITERNYIKLLNIAEN